MLKGTTTVLLNELEPYEEKGGVKILNDSDKPAEQKLVDGFIVCCMIDCRRFGSLRQSTNHDDGRIM